jgi:hypothetical protein
MKLENEFEKNHYIVGQERKDLAKHLNLPEAKVSNDSHIRKIISNKIILRLKFGIKIVVQNTNV